MVTQPNWPIYEMESTRMHESVLWIVSLSLLYLTTKEPVFNSTGSGILTFFFLSSFFSPREFFWVTESETIEKRQLMKQKIHSKLSNEASRKVSIKNRKERNKWFTMCTTCMIQIHTHPVQLFFQTWVLVVSPTQALAECQARTGETLWQLSKFHH